MALSEPDIELLRSLVARRSGNVLQKTHGYLLESRLASVAASAGFANVETFVAELKRSPVKFEDVVAEAMTINETSFFRDIQPFEILRTEILPEILEAQSASRELSIWCAASSSGQEPYSIAMLLQEHFPHLNNWKIRILATDFSEKMVSRTREGRYSQFEVSRGLPTRMLIKYFEQIDGQWRVKNELRRWVECRNLNLTGPWFAMPKFNIVFIRNVLIYFDQSKKQTILQRIAHSMSANSALFLGGGESIVGLDVPFQSRAFEKGVCFQPTTSMFRFPPVANKAGDPKMVLSKSACH